LRYKIIIGILLFCLFLTLRNNYRLKEEVDSTEEAYNQGWYDALDCVKNKRGSADAAIRDCE